MKNKCSKFSLIKKSLEFGLLEINNNDPILQLLQNYSEFIEIQNYLNESLFFKLLYFNRVKFHQILYDEGETFYICCDNIEISSLFYITLLIEENKYIINYEYSIDLIKKIDKLKNLELYENIIYSKIILCLINNFKQLNADGRNNLRIFIIEKLKIEGLKKF